LTFFVLLQATTPVFAAAILSRNVVLTSDTTPGQDDLRLIGQFTRTRRATSTSEQDAVGNSPEAGLLTTAPAPCPQSHNAEHDVPLSVGPSQSHLVGRELPASPISPDTVLNATYIEGEVHFTNPKFNSIPDGDKITSMEPDSSAAVNNGKPSEQNNVPSTVGLGPETTGPEAQDVPSPTEPQPTDPESSEAEGGLAATPASGDAGRFPAGPAIHAVNTNLQPSPSPFSTPMSMDVASDPHNPSSFGYATSDSHPSIPKPGPGIGYTRPGAGPATAGGNTSRRRAEPSRLDPFASVPSSNLPFNSVPSVDTARELLDTTATTIPKPFNATGVQGTSAAPNAEVAHGATTADKSNFVSGNNVNAVSADEPSGSGTGQKTITSADS